MPLQLDVDKIVIFGDPQQLPYSCNSQNLNDKNYEKSIMDRHQKIKEIPYLLSTQYRMRGKIY